jgi:hypothetical protein
LLNKSTSSISIIDFPSLADQVFQNIFTHNINYINSNQITLKYVIEYIFGTSVFLIKLISYCNHCHRKKEMAFA